MFIPNRNTPRWIIFLIDLFIACTSYFVAILLRFEFNPPADELEFALYFFPIFLGVRAASFIIGKTYAGIIRYTSTQDAQRIFWVIAAGSVLFGIMNQVRFHFMDQVYFIPYSVIFIDFLFSLFAMIFSRIAVKVLYLELKSPVKSKINVVIFGAGESGLITKRAIDRDSKSGLNVQAFIDDDKRKSGKKIEGVSIYHSTKADELFNQGKIDRIIISPQQIDPTRKSAIINKALAYNIRVMDVPPVTRWINGELSVRQLRNIDIDDLLGRPAIRLDLDQVKSKIEGKVVLVTGAAGSIGSELVRQIIAYNPKKIILVDQAETPLYEFELELKTSGQIEMCDFVIADVRQLDRVKRMMNHFMPNLVFHAAAYKHVPLMEENPSEAVLTNVMGTKNMVDVSHQIGVESFVFISTDKAVNPTSVMGASKRLAEMYAQSMNANSPTQFITTRFGNVLGSNGSVIPLFKRQMSNGGPLTVTHEDITRYFMTIPEAVQLVLEASAMGEGGEIFVFDMGESVRIIDLARNMIKLSGLIEGCDPERNCMKNY
jgi:FlaA1/EpsC-like NDP-sugar epimerase